MTQDETKTILDALFGPENDNINHPKHYTDGKYEVTDFIEEKGLGFHLGNTVKYICRAGKKDPDKKIEDLKKAYWYLSRYRDLKQAKELKKNDTITIDCSTGYASCSAVTISGDKKEEKLPIDVVDFCIDKKLDYLLSNCIVDIVNKNMEKAQIALMAEINELGRKEE